MSLTSFLQGMSHSEVMHDQIAVALLQNFNYLTAAAAAAVPDGSQHILLWPESTTAFEYS